MTLTELHAQALAGHWAVPHFNFSSLAQANGIIDAVVAARAPVVLGLSEGERDFVGLAQAVYLAKSFEDTQGIPVFLNADHTKSVERAKEAVDAGFSSIHIDLSKEPYDKNLAGVKEVVAYAKDKNSDINVEGELGYFATESSKRYTEAVEIPEDSFTKPEEAATFVQETGVDRFAPAVGTLHGIAANKPVLRFDLIEAIRKIVPDEVALVLHGGSGVADEDIKKAVEMGFNNIHVSTELRVAYSDALRKTLQEKPNEVAPYHYLKEARAAVAAVTRQKLDLFNTVNVV
ncbi:MAG: class II fructose-bisphosphate aldolase [Candidatus Spechtbacterales bacterium]